MAEANYERQHLAIHAAGFINAAGTTRVTFGCQMTRIAAGQYGLTLDASSGVIDDETFTMVVAKGAVARAPVVEDTSNFLKTIRTFDTAGALQDTDIEVSLFKSVTH